MICVFPVTPPHKQATLVTHRPHSRFWTDIYDQDMVVVMGVNSCRCLSSVAPHSLLTNQNTSSYSIKKTPHTHAFRIRHGFALRAHFYIYLVPNFGCAGSGPLKEADVGPRGCKIPESILNQPHLAGQSSGGIQRRRGHLCIRDKAAIIKNSPEVVTTS